MKKKIFKKKTKTFFYRLAILLFLLLPMLLTLITPALALEKKFGPELIDHTIMIDENGIPYREEFYDENDNIHSRIFFSAQDNIYEDSPKDSSYYVAYLNAKSWDGKYSYLNFKNASNPGSDDGYTTGNYGKDGAYIGEFNGKYRVQQAGVLMDFDKRDINLVEYSKANISYYYINNDFIYHKIYYKTNSVSSHRVGLAPSYMKEGVKYYSYDGHYFYTSYPTLVQDVQKQSHQKSINPSNPHYNYYQFLSHRSKTVLTAEDYNQVAKTKAQGANSKMLNLGQAFIDTQNNYGVNSLLMFGLAGNESNWGRSKIAIDKNNLFGHGAVDSNPYWGANGYDSPELSIRYHADNFIKGYLDAEDWKYNGPHLGDKASGMSVRYASDPYWGEKAASIAYYDENMMKDYGKVKLGVIHGQLKNYKLYQSPLTSSPIVHILGSGKSPKTYEHPIIILDDVKDSKNKAWYKIQFDTPLNSSRTDLNDKAIYNFDRDYVFIPADNVEIIFQGDETAPQYKRGDVNNNKKIDAADYLMIMDTILGKYKMSSLQKQAGDVNRNGKIDAADYLMVMDSILGKITL